ncbi:L-ascorbate metabolism protein UlaG, beta-lactamase superfamily [Reichenbachiella faecimaris]|uniref:L-ascorbate metabolism protein UlaG, beta-lactamase superfamily n=1 Tax=Reichenbachiella faecimaris TaxID=692418 RepID=A0A1W2G848_REIFA|nr:MBL fold metallo-hydrolase [Reichenbachiella faecimaris]SMD32508.1 L-ascorbate metabolism protein UlaG, beta-lactamase superfamily [Reichenbachiella faecimaris]
MFKILKMTLLTIFLAVLAVGILVVVFFKTAPQIGEPASGKRLEEVKASPQYRDGKFYNSVQTDTEFPISKYIKVMYQFATQTKGREPEEKIETFAFDAQKWIDRDENEIMLSWFGHSSALIKIDGKTILADPVFGERASMFSFMGPKKFAFSHQMDVNQLPDVDLVIISHDHYDHLDYPTISQLKDKVKLFYVPLGVASHLESWGISAENIKTFDWWDEASLDENVKLTFAPTRHFSGRGLTDKFTTLWGSWVIEGSGQKLYFSGDSGYFPGFKEIGKKFGGFDLALMECGAYNRENWPDIHMLPEQSVQAALDVQARIAMPIHWGKFNLALHLWKDPIQRFIKAAQLNNLQTHTPIMGDVLIIPSETKKSEWWENYK